MTEQLAALGIIPSVVVGHSIGEYAAAVCTGVMTLESAVLLVANRGKMIRDHGLEGAMITVQCDEQQAHAMIEELGLVDKLYVAAVNSQSNTTLAGTEPAIEAVIDLANFEGLKITRLHVSRAFHTPLTEPARTGFKGFVESQPLSEPKLQFVSTLSGHCETGYLTDPNYWVLQVERPVRFLDAVRARCNDGRVTWIEIGPRPALSSLLNKIDETNGSFIGATSHRRLDEGIAFMDLVQRLFTYGYPIDWNRYFGDARMQRLPLYPFQHREYWHDVLPVQQLEGGGHSPKGAAATPSKADRVNLCTTMTSEGEGQTIKDSAQIVRTLTSKVTGIPTVELESAQLLWNDLGFNSMMIVDLKLELERAFPKLRGVKFQELSSVLTLGDLESFVGTRSSDSNANVSVEMEAA
jgi:acyl transferase domain-containing protein